MTVGHIIKMALDKSKLGPHSLASCWGIYSKVVNPTSKKQAIYVPLREKDYVAQVCGFGVYLLFVTFSSSSNHFCFLEISCSKLKHLYYQH